MTGGLSSFGFGTNRRRGTPPPPPVHPLTVVTRPVIAGGAPQGSTLTLTQQATWSKTTGFTRSYQWYRRTARGLFQIPGAIHLSYVTQPADIGADITIAERADNGALSAPSHSNAIRVTSPAPAVLPNAVLLLLLEEL